MAVSASRTLIFPLCSTACWPGLSVLPLTFTAPCSRVVFTSGSSLYALILKAVPSTSTAFAWLITLKGLAASLATSKYASPLNSTRRSGSPANDGGKVSREAAFSHTREPSGRSMRYCPPLGVLMVLVVALPAAAPCGSYSSCPSCVFVDTRAALAGQFPVGGIVQGNNIPVAECEHGLVAAGHNRRRCNVRHHRYDRC